MGHGGCEDFWRHSTRYFLLEPFTTCSILLPMNESDDITGFFTGCAYPSTLFFLLVPPMFTDVYGHTKSAPRTQDMLAEAFRGWDPPRYMQHLKMSVIFGRFSPHWATIMRGRKISTNLKYTILVLGGLHSVSEITALTAVSHRQIYCIRENWETTGYVEPDHARKKMGRPWFLTRDKEAVSFPSIH